MPFPRGIDVVDHLDYDEWHRLGHSSIWQDATMTTLAMLHDEVWIPKSQLCVFSKSLWVKQWFADREGLS